MHKCLRYLKINGRYHDKGSTLKVELPKEEVESLIKAGFLKSANAQSREVITATNVIPEQTKEVEEVAGEMTDEEVKKELMEKITHAVAVKELELLGAEFKKNASLESLVDLIVENEEYEDHFFDYIDAHGL